MNFDFPAFRPAYKYYHSRIESQYRSRTASLEYNVTNSTPIAAHQPWSLASIIAIAASLSPASILSIEQHQAFTSMPSSQPNVTLNGPRSLQTPATIDTHRVPRYLRAPASPNSGQANASITGDASTLTAAQYEIRKNFDRTRSLLLDSEETSKRIAQAEEIAKFLRENVVQGEAVDAEASRYSMWRVHCSLY